MNWWARSGLGGLLGTRRSAFRKNVMLLAGGTALGHAVALLASPMLTRLYTTEQFGELQLYISGLTFLVVVASFKYETAILLPESDRDAVHVLVLCLLITTGLAGGVVGLVFALKSISLGKAEALKPHLWLLPLGLLGAGWFQSLSNWAIRRGGYPEVARSKLMQTVGQVLAQLLFGWASRPASLLGLLAGDTAGRLMAGGGFLRLSWREAKDFLSPFSWTRVAVLARLYWRFPLISVGSSLLNTAGFALVPFLIAKLYGYSVLGWFALVNRVLGIPLMLVGQATSQVFMGHASAHLARPEELRAQFRRTLRNLALIGFVPFMLVVLLAPALFPRVFGPQWGPAGAFARILALSFYLSFVVWPTMPMLEMLQKQRYQVLWDVARLALVMFSLIVPRELGWTVTGAMACYSAVTGLAYLTHALLTHWVLERSLLPEPRNSP